MQNNNIYPFLRWVGGKQWLLKNINNYLPQKFHNYHELFLGGASLFTYLSNNDLLGNKVYLSDTNQELINAYVQIRDNVDILVSLLKQYKNQKHFYYRVRNKKLTNNIELAARFIYLNRTSFNGIYRVNREGEYNVPYGFKKYKNLFDFDNMLRFSKKLNEVNILNNDFEDCLQYIKKNDLVFLDPPYTTTHQNNGFIKYNQKLFSLDDQKRLSEFMKLIKSRGAYFISTNAYHKNVIRIFQNFNMDKFKRYSVVSAKSSARKIINELIFFNTV